MLIRIFGQNFDTLFVPQVSDSSVPPASFYSSCFLPSFFFLFGITRPSLTSLSNILRETYKTLSTFRTPLRRTSLVLHLQPTSGTTTSILKTCGKSTKMESMGRLAIGTLGRKTNRLGRQSDDIPPRPPAQCDQACSADTYDCHLCCDVVPAGLSGARRPPTGGPILLHRSSLPVMNRPPPQTGCVD